MAKIAKIWGVTEPLFLAPGMHMHRITFEAGGVCSEHVHHRRHNLFYVISGVLVVREWTNDGRVVETVLRAHEHTNVISGVRHQFEALQSGVALEVYWSMGGSDNLSEFDIFRFTQGFMR